MRYIFKLIDPITHDIDYTGTNTTYQYSYSIRYNGLIFSRLTNLTIAATPSTGQHLIAYDLDGKLKQKNDQGVITEIGSGSGIQGIPGDQGLQGSQGPQGIPGPVGPSGLTWSGIWSPTGSYMLHDAVSFASASWFCVESVTGSSIGISPSVSQNWALLASQGSPGPEGPQGPQGPSAETFRFSSDIQVALQANRTFGKYINGDVIPATNKTVSEVLLMSVSQELAPTLELSSLSNIGFGQTAVSNLLSYTYSINSLGATISSTLLEWKRDNSIFWTTLSTDTNLMSYRHSMTDAAFATQAFNYRYTVIDSQGGNSYVTKDITPASYVAPSISLSVIGFTLSSIETNLKREIGNIESNITGTITRMSTNANLSYFQVEYQKDGGSWQTLGSASSIAAASTSYPFSIMTLNNSLSDATSIGYRVIVTDSYTTTTSDVVTINFYNVIFYGDIATKITQGSSVRTLPSKIFTNGLNPFTLSTGTANKVFCIAMPSTLSITDVIDLTAQSQIITNKYVNSSIMVPDFFGTGKLYNLYTMTNGTNYSDYTHLHQVTRTT